MELRGLVVVEDLCNKNSGGPGTVPATEQVANLPIVRLVLDSLTGAGISDVIVVTSKRAAEPIRSCLTADPATSAGSLRFVSHRGPVQLASAIGLAAPLIGGAACVVHAAGGLLAAPLTPLIAALDEGSDVILTVQRAPSVDGRLSSQAQSLLGLAELDPSRSALGAAGVWVLGPGAVQQISAGEPVVDTPDTTAASPLSSDIVAVAQRIRSTGGTIQVRLVDAWRVYRGNAADLLELNRIVLDGIEADVPHGVADANRVEGRVRVHESASVTDSVLVGPAVIGPGARISDAYIGPFTAIGAGCRIEGAEIERSIVSPEARVSHVGSRITDSVVGQGAHVFRHFSMPRALHLRVGADAELGLC